MDLAQVRQDQFPRGEVAGREETCLAVGGICFIRFDAISIMNAPRLLAVIGSQTYWRLKRETYGLDL